MKWLLKHLLKYLYLCNLVKRPCNVLMMTITIIIIIREIMVTIIIIIITIKCFDLQIAKSLNKLKFEAQWSKVWNAACPKKKSIYWAQSKPNEPNKYRAFSLYRTWSSKKYVFICTVLLCNIEFLLWKKYFILLYFF